MIYLCIIFIHTISMINLSQVSDNEVDQLLPCVICLSPSMRQGTDKRSNPFFHCLGCGARIFVKAPERDAGLELFRVFVDRFGFQRLQFLLNCYPREALSAFFAREAEDMAAELGPAVDRAMRNEDQRATKDKRRTLRDLLQQMEELDDLET